MSTEPLDPKLWYMADPPRFELRATENMLEWAYWRGKADVRVARTNLTESIFVSTVFLGTLHLDPVKPGVVMDCLFETMIFGLNDHLQDAFVKWKSNTSFSIIAAAIFGRGEFQRRYRTVQEAREGHEETVNLLRYFLASVN